VPVREGESVRAGQLLARIDTADLEAKLIERNGALESAKAQLAMAAKTRTTNQQLLKQNFISQNAYDNSESSVGVSQGTVKSAEAQVQIARNALRDAIAMSPLAGGGEAPRSGRREGGVRFPSRHDRRPDRHGAAGSGTRR
jgi:multidrug efflux pump subunit AcrA (membrane-fusion protein)